MMDKSMLTLVNPQTGSLAFKIYHFDNNSLFEQVQRLSHYALIWVTSGSGKIKADFSEYAFSNNCLMAFSPYQPFMITASAPFEGVVLNFHPDFFCIHKHQQEVACNGVLFNNIYDPPIVPLDEAAAESFDILIAQMKKEMQRPALAQHELLVSYLKIFLITASRIKTPVPQAAADYPKDVTPFVLQNLKNFIEAHYKTKHAPADYAQLLNISPKALAKITKAHFNKTLTDLISERIIIEAKRELYLSNKAIKEIAWELGYSDEYYFSRFFKNNVNVSPQVYRETIGVGKAFINN